MMAEPKELVQGKEGGGSGGLATGAVTPSRGSPG